MYVRKQMCGYICSNNLTSIYTPQKRKVRPRQSEGTMRVMQGDRLEIKDPARASSKVMYAYHERHQKCERRKSKREI